ncbi:MAG: hypothetical protein ACJAVI_003465 [Candidatus Azotimanducaceae bacterium]|jgi:hypothetical protein
MPDLVSSAVLEGIAGLVEQAGRDPADMAQRVGISAAALYNPDVLISPYRVNDLLELAATECEDRFLGLKIANVQGFDILGGVWLMARHAKTVGETMQLIAQHLPLHVDTMSVYISSEGVSGKLLVVEFHSPVQAGRQTALRPWSMTQSTELCLSMSSSVIAYSLIRI